MKLNVTKALRKRFVADFGVAEDADEDAFRKAVSDALVAGTIELDEVKTLTTEPPTAAEAKLQDLVAKATDPLTKGLADLTALVTKLTTPPDKPAETSVETKATAVADPPETKPEGEGLAAKAMGKFGAAGASTTQDDARIRVKKVVEQFGDTRTAALMTKGHNAGKQACADDGRPLDAPTPRKDAIAGAWFHKMATDAMRRSGMHVPAHYMDNEFTELRKQLQQYAVHECNWVGSIHETGAEMLNTKMVSDLHRKAVLDDSTSGGLEAVPIEFDDNLIITPLLQGELFPRVTVRQVSRRRIEAAALGNVTIGWGTSEGTAIGLFDTDSLISAFDNNLYPVTGSIELGMDFLADSPQNIGAAIREEYGKAFRKEMDDVIANGDGTSQPEGLFQKSGVTANAWGADAATVGDYEGLLFGVAKEYRTTGRDGVFIGTDTSYSRARGIAVGDTDQRRVFGMDEESYMLMGHPYLVNGNITNAQIMYVMLSYYVLYRRAGLEVRTVREDWELARKNAEGIVIRARFGGALTLAGAACKTTTALA